MTPKKPKSHNPQQNTAASMRGAAQGTQATPRPSGLPETAKEPKSCHGCTRPATVCLRWGFPPYNYNYCERCALAAGWMGNLTFDGGRWVSYEARKGGPVAALRETGIYPQRSL